MDVEGTDAIFIAVGTPLEQNRSSELQYVIKAGEEIERSMKKYAALLIKSTVPVGTSEIVRKEIHGEVDKRQVNMPFDITSNPEFLLRDSS